MFTEGQVPDVKNARHCLSRQAAARIRPRLREPRIVRRAKSPSKESVHILVSGARAG